MTTATDRLTTEQLFHNHQARQRADYFDQHAAELRFDDATYLDHETWIRPAFACLGELRGMRVLDYGCGHGMAAVVLARHGARVTAFDLSAGYLAETAARAVANGVSLDCVQVNGERLPFADASFDRIWGNAILHHLDLSVAAPELYRVLQPGGVAVFSEPWGENPLLSWAHQYLPYAGKERTPEEQPLRRRDLHRLQTAFPRVTVQGYQLLSMVRRVLPRGRLVAGLDWCDTRLLGTLPGLQRWCRYVVLTLHRPAR